MKDLIIISDKPITYESISDLVKKEFKSYPLLNDDWFGTVQEYIDNYEDDVFPWQRK